MAIAIANSIAPGWKRGLPRFSPDQYHSFSNLAEAFFFNANKNFDLVAYDQPVIDSEFDHEPRRYVSTLQRTTKERVLRIAAQLLEWGVRPQDKVAVLSLNRPEWTESEMAIYAVGAVTVALYVRISQDRLEHMLNDANASCAVVENEEQLRRILQAIQNRSSTTLADRPHEVGLTKLEHILSLEEITIPPEAARLGVEVKTLRKVLADQPVRDERSFPFVDVQRADLASIYYTSGSSGLPTGVPVTHGQTLENLYQIATAGLVDFSHYDRPDAPPLFITLLLPERAHAFPARNTQLAATSPVRVRYPAVVDRKVSQVSEAYRDSLRRDLREGGAGIVPIVPKVLVTIEQRVRHRFATGGFGERFAGLLVNNAARKIQNDASGTPNRMTSFLYRVLSPLRNRITRKIRKQIVGPEFDFFISGGAKLPVETAAFLWAIDLPVYEGYGSTESNCPIATNTPICYRLGSVGKVFSGVETSVDPTTGELWLRGPNVVLRYWNVAPENQHAWTEDGWYRTRDVGRLDSDGFLYIDDRIDNILVAWNGENVSASAIEQRFFSIPYIDSVVVLGHQRPALVALISLNEDVVRHWAKRSGRLLATDWQHDPAVIALLRREVEVHVNQPAGHPCERVRHFTVIDALAPENQTLTATEKVRRREIERRYATQIEQMYKDQEYWLASFESPADASVGHATVRIMDSDMCRELPQRQLS